MKNGLKVPSKLAERPCGKCKVQLKLRYSGKDTTERCKSLLVQQLIRLPVRNIFQDNQEMSHGENHVERWDLELLESK